MHVLMIIATNYRHMTFRTVNYVLLLTDGARVALYYRKKLSSSRPCLNVQFGTDLCVTLSHSFPLSHSYPQLLQHKS